ncbi:MAG TPA: DUF5606 domain-containing protein [Sphingobacteriaceae bacterium]|nr:DUF5606 domain-containing protein [Sphingobacteriaceae bacterium]
MNLKGIVSVSGRSGLFKLIGQNKSAFVLESLEDQKVKIVVNMSTVKLASLEDITVFGEVDDLKLMDIFDKMKDSDVPDTKIADGAALRKYFRVVAPDHDEEKVYASDMKKIISWFLIIKELPLFTEDAPEASSSEEKVPVIEDKKQHTTVDKPKPTRAPKKAAARLSQKSK